LKAPAIAPDLRELIEATLGILDLVARREIDRRVEGDVDHIFADGDQLAPGREVVDRTPIVHRIDDGRGFGCQTGEVLSERQPGNVDLSGQERLQGHRRGQLAGANEAPGDVVDLLVDWLEEMRGLEKITYAIKCLVVDEDGTQKRLFRFNVVRCGAIGRRRLARLLARGRIEGCHDVGANRFPICRKSGALTPLAISVRPFIAAFPVTHRTK
jgi:hypothetical protein